MLNLQHLAFLPEIRSALRAWARHRGFAALAIATLALGMSVTTAVFSVVNAMLLGSFGYADMRRLIEISGRDQQGRPTGVSGADFLDLQKRSHSFVSLGATRFQAFTLIGANEPESLYGQLVSQDCFSTLGARPLLGRPFSADDFQSGAPPVVALSYKLWQRSFNGDPAAVGRHVFLDGADHQVIAVMPPEFQFPHPAFQLWVPTRINPGEFAGRRTRLYQLVARLKPNVSPQTAQTELQSLSAALAAEFPSTNAGWRAVSAPINDQLLGKLRPALLTMLGAVGFVLAIACLNVSNLLMARGLGRSREFAIRGALGASRLRMMRQLLIESLLLAAAGGLLGLLLARGLLRLLIALLPVRAVPIFPRMEDAALDARVGLAALLLSLAAGLFFGLLPALEFSRPQMEPALQEGGRGHTGGRRQRRLLGVLIALEAALSVVLLAGAGLMLRSFLRILDSQPGFHPDHVLTALIPSPFKPGLANNPAETTRKVDYLRSLVEQAQGLPGVTAAALTTDLPLAAVQVQTMVRFQGRPAPRPGEEFRVGYSAVSPGYFRAMGIPLLRGRAFSDADGPGSPLVAIVDQAMARRFWPGEDALGQRITFNPSAPPAGPWITIVGIAADVRRFNLREDADSQIYASYPQSLLSPQTAALVLRTPLDPAALASSLRTVVHRVDPSQPVAEVKTMSQIVWDSIAQTRLYTVLLSLFAALAAILAAAGVFSVISWMVNQSAREIGIRMALGAAPAQVLRSLMARALLETLAGGAVGLLAAAALTGVMKSQLYQVRSLDPAVFAAALLLLAAIAAAAAFVSARRSLAVDPAIALR